MLEFAHLRIQFKRDNEGACFGPAVQHVNFAVDRLLGLHGANLPMAISPSKRRIRQAALGILVSMRRVQEFCDKTNACWVQKHHPELLLTECV